MPDPTSNQPLFFCSAFALMALAMVGCDSCESGGPVPFGLDAGQGSPAARPVEHEPRRTVELLVRELPGNTPSAEIDGSEVSIVGGSIRAIGAWDFDGDGDRDALVMSVDDAEARGRLWTFVRDPQTFSMPSELGRTPRLSGRCMLARTAVRSLGDSITLAEFGFRCSESEHEEVEEIHSFVISGGASPRVLEKFTLSREARDEGGDSIAIRAEDRDGDAHVDLVAELSLEAGTDSPARVRIAFLDRPGGFAREPNEPEATMAALAEQARNALRREPERALGIASQAVSIWDAVCHESGHARFDVGGHRVSCGRSGAAGRALAVSTQAAARTGRPLLAVEAMERMQRATIAVRDRDREAARSALGRLGGEIGDIHEGPRQAADAERTLRRSMLGFLDEHRILIRGPSPRVFDIAQGSESPAEDAMVAALGILSPSSEYELVAIERRCAGTVLVLAPVAGEIAATRKTALVASRRAPLGTPCPELTPALRADDDGWRVLGWAPQGVLVARHTELRLVPLDIAAEPMGEPITLEEGAVIPAPIAPGAATSDARALVYSVPGGFVLVEFAPERRASFIRPAAHGDVEGMSFDVAVSPSTARIAWIAEGRVFWLERRAASD